LAFAAEAAATLLDVAWMQSSSRKPITSQGTLHIRHRDCHLIEQLAFGFDLAASTTKMAVKLQDFACCSLRSEL
jgi:hypothetical protein